MAARHAAKQSDAAYVGQRLHTINGIEQLARMRENRSLIVDMDDTLISNQSHFDDATDELVALFYRLDPLNRNPGTLRDLHTEVDAGMVPSLGYTPERWFVAAHKTAEIVAGRDLTALESEEVRKAAGIAMSTGHLLPGVEDTLEACHKAGLRMVLKTKGCRDKQTEKLVTHRFSRYFGERIWIVDRKDPDSFTLAAQHFKLPNPVSIGDSARSDVAPARQAGMDAILLSGGANGVAWEQGVKLQQGTMRSPSFPEAVQLLLDIEAVKRAQG